MLPTIVIRLHLLLKYLITAVGYEEARDGTSPESLLKRKVLSVITLKLEQPVRASFCLFLPLWDMTALPRQVT